MKLLKLFRIRIAYYFIPLTVLLLAITGGAAYAATPYPGCTTIGSTKVTYSDPHTGKVLATYTEPYQQTMGYGASGTCVSTLQQQLNKWCATGTQLAVDGQYGPKTQLAVEHFQYDFTPQGQYYVWRVNGNLVSVDGITGPQTWSIMHVYDGIYPYGNSSSRGGLACDQPLP